MSATLEERRAGRALASARLRASARLGLRSAREEAAFALIATAGALLRFRPLLGYLAEQIDRCERCDRWDPIGEIRPDGLGIYSCRDCSCEAEELEG